MSNTQPYEILAGPLTVWYAEVGTPFPNITDSLADIRDAGSWTPIGLTEGGIKVAHPQTVVELRADQVTGVVKAVRSEEGLEVTFDIASLTLENYSLALNQAISGPDTITHGKSTKLYRGGFAVETFALLARQDGLSPYGDYPLSFEVPVVFEAGSPEDTHTKDNKAVLAVSLHAMVDPNRTDDSESFGRLNAGDNS